jgi:outer membrane protein OmpA-like peptidoglycan-associated protein
MSLERWRRLSADFLAIALTSALALTLLSQGCSRSPERAGATPASGTAASASAETAAPAADAENDEGAAAAGALLGRLVADAAPRERPARKPDGEVQELAPPPGVDLSRAPAIPLVEGLTVVTAIADPNGDYESVKRIASIGNERVQVSYSATRPGASDGWREVSSGRSVFVQDLKTGRAYRMAFTSGQTQVFRGATALGVSAAVLEELRGDGRSECALAALDDADSVLGSVGLAAPEYDVTLERVGSGRVAVPVLLDGERQWLPAIRAKGTIEALSGDVDVEFWFLDNAGNALTLRARLGENRLVATRIDRPRAVAARLEQALASEERVELPGIYFEFASATLRPESDATIKEVAELLRRKPDWRVRFDGHTDNIGGTAANLDLSKRRAEAVRAAVVKQLGGEAERFESAGYGAGNPRESNDTPEGRARNRRVELIRMR